MVWWEMPADGMEGIVAFHREVEGNKVIVLANFGVPAPAQEVQAAAEGNDNRPQGEQVAEPFKNLKGEPTALHVKLDGKYQEAFTGEIYEAGEKDFLLWPGDFVVLTK